jgi:hypothetical protein
MKSVSITSIVDRIRHSPLHTLREDFLDFLGHNTIVSAILGMGLALACTAFCWMHLRYLSVSGRIDRSAAGISYAVGESLLETLWCFVLDGIGNFTVGSAADGMCIALAMLVGRRHSDVYLG